MTTSLVENSAPIGRAAFVNDPVVLASAEGEFVQIIVRMALANPPGMRLAADAT